MNLFVGFHFAPEDAWVRELVLPLVGAFGFDAVTGEEMYGHQLTNEVIQRIKGSCGLLGFVTRRGNDSERTHRWVTDELASAVTAGIKVLEVREVGLDDQRRLLGDRQHIEYDPQRPAHCLVQLAAALGQWAKEPAPTPVRVIPQEAGQLSERRALKREISNAIAAVLTVEDLDLIPLIRDAAERAVALGG